MKVHCELLNEGKSGRRFIDLRRRKWNTQPDVDLQGRSKWNSLRDFPVSHTCFFVFVVIFVDFCDFDR